MSLFGRKVTVTVGQAGALGAKLTDLRVNFRVKMSQSSAPNEATIRIWNPNPLTISVLEVGPLPTVVLAAGYEDPLDPTGAASVPRMIFIGDVIKDGLIIRKEGPDRIVEISAKDGGFAVANTRINLTFKTPTSFSAVVEAIQKQMLLPKGLILVVPDLVLANGGNFVGQASDILDRLAAATGNAWWISDNVFFFAPTAAALPLVAPLFSSKFGNLIGEPKKKDRGGVEVRALLDASLRPGGSFVLESTTLAGTYIATDVVFEGDSGFDRPFYVTTTGRLPVG